MLKIYHQDSLRKTQRRRLWSAFAIGLMLGTIVAFGGRSVDMISPAYASDTEAPTHHRPSAAERQAPLTLQFSHAIEARPR